MVINYCGDGCFKVQSGSTSILVDPLPRYKGDIVLNSQAPISNLPFPLESLAGGGEYEIKGIEIRGWQAPKESSAKEIKTVYSVKAEEINLVFLGGLAEALEPAFLEKFGTTDIVFIPAGGKPLISEEAAAKLIKQISPKIVVGSFVKTLDQAKKFFKELNQKPEIQEKLVIKKKDLPQTISAVILQM